MSEVLAAGPSRYDVERAVDRGELLRPRRGWVAVPGADADLVAAARCGVVLTCVTQSARMGLWTVRDRQPHVAATSHARMQATGCVVHWQRPVVPRRPHALEDTVQNVLQCVAGCQPAEHALVVWESALNKRLVDLESLRRLDYGHAARGILAACRPFADSGLETIAAQRLRWLRVPLTPQAHICGRRVDLLIGERLVLQIDGATHTGAQRDADNAFDAELALRGYTVIRVGYHQVMEDWAAVQRRIQEAVAQHLHLHSRGVGG